MARLAGSLVTLRDEVNRAYPGRRTSSDGWIGDAAHAARKSDHNPDSAGWVRAIDVSEWDPYTPQEEADDVAEALAEYLRAKRDPRVKYVIWRGRIFTSYAVGSRKAWQWGRYTGPNGHFIHCHVSVVADGRGLDPSPWGFTRPGAGSPRGISPGARGNHVEFLQAMGNILHRQRINVYGKPGGRIIDMDGIYGRETTELVREVQRFLRAMGQLAGHAPQDLVAVSGTADAKTLAQMGWWVQQVLKG